MRFVMVALQNFGLFGFVNRKESNHIAKSEDILSYQYLDTNKLNINEMNNFIKKNCNFTVGRNNYPIPLLNNNDYQMVVVSGFTVLYSLNDKKDTQLVLFDLNHAYSSDILSILRDKKISDIQNRK